MNKEIKRDAIIGAVIVAGAGAFYLYHRKAQAQAQAAAPAVDQQALDNAAALEQVQALAMTPANLNLPSLGGIQSGGSEPAGNSVQDLASQVQSLMDLVSPQSTTSPANPNYVAPIARQNIPAPVNRTVTATVNTSKINLNPSNIEPVGPQIVSLN